MSVFKVGSNKSSQNNFPSVRPTLDLDFANSKTLDPRITFTRASGGSYVGADGLIKYAGVNEPRFDHDQNTGESLGLLIEESRTNFIRNSVSFDANWSNNVPGATDTAAQIITNTTETLSPDGTNNAAKIIQANTGWQRILQGVTISNNNRHTFSIFVKQGNSNMCVIELTGSFNAGGRIQWNFNTETFSEFSSNFNNLNYVKYPNGWYRLSGDFLATSNSGTTGSVWFFPGDDFNGPPTPPAAFTYVYGYQLEEGAFPTSYIPTVASTRTRAADNASMTGTNFSSWYNQSEGSVYSNVKYNARPISGIANRTNWCIKSISGLVWQLWWENTNTGALLNQEFGVSNALIFRSGAIISPGDQVKMASAFKTNNYAFSQAGGTAQTNNSVVLLNNYTELELGAVNQVSTNYLNGTIARLTYYPKRLTDAQLQVLTR